MRASPLQRRRGQRHRANRPHRVSASGAKSAGRSKTGNPAPLSGALTSKNCFGSPKTSRRSHGANAECAAPCSDWGRERGARAAKAAHRMAREVARGTEKARTHSAEHRRQSGGRTSENGQRRRKWHPRNRTGSTQPPTGEGAKRRRRGGRPKAETKDRKHAPANKGGCPKRRRPHRTKAEPWEPHPSAISDFCRANDLRYYLQVQRDGLTKPQRKRSGSTQPATQAAQVARTGCANRARALRSRPRQSFAASPLSRAVARGSGSIEPERVSRFIGGLLLDIGNIIPSECQNVGQSDVVKQRGKGV